jgi:hypothetical protein
MCLRPTVTGLLVLCAALPACITDSVPVNLYVSESVSRTDASADAGTKTKPDARTDAAPEAGREDPDIAPGDDPELPDMDGDDAGASSADDAETGTTGDAAVDNGPCDLTGSWLITQHGVFQALGVKQTAQSWFFYELQQSGGTLKVTKGLACGGRVVPLDALGAAVAWEPAWPATISKNSHTGRLGKVSASGTSCTVSFDIAYTILGASVAYYSDPSHDLPKLAQKAAGDEPGWEDWDDDGKPGVSFNTSGFATGVRYSVQRVYNDWTTGTYSPGAKLLKMVSVTQTDESVLGATSDLIKTLSAPDSNPASGFTQLARLDASQAQGDDEALCATVRDLAPTLTPEANSK